MSSEPQQNGEDQEPKRLTRRTPMPRAVYTPEIADRVCAGLAAGRVLPEVCRDVGLLPYEYYEWRRSEEAFKEQTENARREASHAYLDSAIEIADNCEADRDAVAKATLRVQTRLRMAALLNPKRYAVGAEAGGGATVQVLVVTGVPEPATRPVIEGAAPSKPST